MYRLPEITIYHGTLECTSYIGEAFTSLGFETTISDIFPYITSLTQLRYSSSSNVIKFGDLSITYCCWMYNLFQAARLSASQYEVELISTALVQSIILDIEL